MCVLYYTRNTMYVHAALSERVGRLKCYIKRYRCNRCGHLRNTHVHRARTYLCASSAPMYLYYYYYCCCYVIVVLLLLCVTRSCVFLRSSGRGRIAGGGGATCTETRIPPLVFFSPHIILLRITATKVDGALRTAVFALTTVWTFRSIHPYRYMRWKSHCSTFRTRSVRASSVNGPDPLEISVVFYCFQGLEPIGFFQFRFRFWFFD
jgi:hypothetical protein